MYVGIRLQCQSFIEIITPAVMPILQCEIAKRQGEMVVTLWNGGMFVNKIYKEGEPEIEATVFISDKKRSIRAIDVIARGPAYSHRNVKQFVDNLQLITMQVVDRKSPGTRTEKRFLSHQHISEHNLQPISYSQEEVESAKYKEGVLTKVINNKVVRDTVIDLLAVEDDHIIYKLQSLCKHCSEHWLRLGQRLLCYADSEVRNFTSNVGEEAKVYHIVETWIRRQWRAATLDTFLKACDSVASGLRELVEIELGIRKPPSTSLPSVRRVIDSAMIQSILRHGADRWYALGLKLGFSHNEISGHCHDKAKGCDKLLVLFEIKAQEIGVKALEDLALKACKTIAIPISGAVSDELKKMNMSESPHK